MLVEYIVNLYDAVIGVFFVTKLSGRRLKDYKLAYIAVFLSFAVSTLFSHFAQTSYILLAVIQVAIHYALLFSKKQGITVINVLSPMIFQMVMATVNVFLIFLFNNLFPVSIADLHVYSYSRYIFILLCKVVMTAVLLIFTKFFDIKERHFALLDLVAYLLFPFITLFNFYIYLQIGIKYDIKEYSGLIVFSVVALGIINVLIFILFRRALQNTSAKQELELLNSRSELEEKRYSEIGNMYQQLQITRHDLKDHLVYIDSLIAQKRYDEVEKYISDRRSELDSTRSVKHTGNRVLDYIINSKLENAKDISFIITGELRELKGIDDLDMASLFGNILDNAIEGTKGSADPSITLEFSVTGNYQNILCRNTIPASVLKDNPKLHTTKKENRHRHGYGIKSIRRIVAKYNGMIEFYEEDGFFCVHIALNC